MGVIAAHLERMNHTGPLSCLANSGNLMSIRSCGNLSMLTYHNQSKINPNKFHVTYFLVLVTKSIFLKASKYLQIFVTFHSSREDFLRAALFFPLMFTLTVIHINIWMLPITSTVGG